MTANLPAYLQNPPSGGRRVSQAVVSNIGTGTPAYVSIKGNRFTLIDSAGDSEPVQTAANGIPYLDCVIIDALERESKIYYGRPFDPSATNYAPPDCWSDNGIAPSRNCGTPQAKSCTPDETHVNGCKWAVWGSATSKVSGKGIPACGKFQKLALLIPGDEVLFLLRVPPNSLDNLRNYMRKFEGQPADVIDVVTRISFEADTLGTLTFQAVKYLDEPVVAARNKALEAKATDTLIGRNDLPRTPVEGGPLPLASTGQQTQIAAPLAAAQSIGSAPQQTATAPGGLASSVALPSEPVVTGARRGRKPKPTEPAPGAQAGQQAPFMDQPAAGAPANNGQASPTSGEQGFGIAPGMAPNPELSQMLDSVFGPGK